MTELEKKAKKYAENFRYSLVAHVYYKKGYEKAIKDTIKMMKEKYDLTTSIDDICDDTAKELEND